MMSWLHGAAVLLRAQRSPFIIWFILPMSNYDVKNGMDTPIGFVLFLFGGTIDSNNLSWYNKFSFMVTTATYVNTP